MVMKLYITSLFLLTFSRGVEVIKPLTDSNEYKSITLSNGMRLMLVRDKQTTLSAASLIVRVGSYESPEDLQGLPHLLEHSLFLGSKNYRMTEGISKLAGRNGGYTNAWTTSRETNYYFEINNDKFKDALDMFGDMLKDPILEPKDVKNELSAVQAEFEKNKSSDESREFRILEILANPRSKMTRFSTGMTKSLDKPEMPKAMHDFFDQHYSANRMGLALLSNMPLDQLEELAKKHFEPLTNKDRNQLDYVFPQMYPKSHLGLLVKMRAIAPAKKLNLFFPIHVPEDEYKFNAVKYAVSCLSSGANGSLLDELLKKGLATNVDFGVDSLASQVQLIEVSIDLTDKGETGYLEILQQVFSTIKNIQTQFNKEHFEEFKKSREINFAYKNQESSVNKLLDLIDNLIYYPPEIALQVKFLAEFNYDLINSVFSQMKPELSVIFLRSQNFKDLPKKEDIYETEYDVHRFSQKELDSFVVNTPAGLPASNPLIPKNLEIDLTQKKTESNQPEKKEGAPEKLKIIPEVIFHDTDETRYPKVCQRVYFFNDPIRFPGPKISATIELYSSPAKKMTAELFIAKLLFEKLLKIEAQELLSQAEQAGFNVNIQTTSQGLSVFTTGFYETLPKFFERIGQIFKNILTTESVTQQSFDNAKAALQTFLSYQVHQRLFSYVMDSLEWIFEENVTSLEQLDLSLAKFTLANFETYRKSLFGPLCYESLVSGEIEKVKAEQMIKNFVQTISPENKEKKMPNIIENKVVKVPKAKKSVLVLPTPNDEKNEVIVSIFQEELVDEKRQKLFHQIARKLLHENFFSKLRTEMQLGYVVLARMDTTRGTNSFYFLVQGSKKNSFEMSQEIQKWLAEKLEKIDTLPDEEFQTARKAVQDNYLQPAASLPQQHVEFFAEIQMHRLRFHNSEESAQEVMKITIQEYREWFKKTFGSGASQLDVHYASKDQIQSVTKSLEALKTENSSDIFTDIEQLKTKTERYDDFWVKF